MWLKDLFGVEKPIIAMCHLQPMPGDPYYDKASGMKKVLESARRDLHALQEGGVDGVMFSNEFSMPYLTKVRPETVASMARVIGELMSDIELPFGVNCLWDPIASLDLAVATGALFIREIMSGVYASDFGLWNTDAGVTVRHQMEIGAEKVKLLYNIVPEAAAYLGRRTPQEIAKTTVFNHRPDALCVSGLTAGSATDTQILKIVKDAAPNTPVFCNTGCNKDNISTQLAVADGAIVATTFKENGVFENPVDSKRVKEFMDVVKKLR
ncbi:MAG: BtpA/SgcQ family protein [Synergistaceae bacterium]|jgi:membrane complex biogenesis BtpA family protein|nr:BtpA/SgcQ family protein [Synergistaceae bacterium]